MPGRRQTICRRHWHLSDRAADFARGVERSCPAVESRVCSSGGAVSQHLALGTADRGAAQLRAYVSAALEAVTSDLRFGSSINCSPDPEASLRIEGSIIRFIAIRLCSQDMGYEESS